MLACLVHIMEVEEAKKLFDARLAPPYKLKQSSLSLARDVSVEAVTAASFLAHGINQQNNGVLAQISWKPPTTGWIKVNIDGVLAQIS